jgi:hypothetical protein
MEQIKAEKIKKPGEVQESVYVESPEKPRSEQISTERVHVETVPITESAESQNVSAPGEETGLMGRMKEGAKYMTESVKETASNIADRLANVVGFGSAEEAKERAGEKYEETKEGAKESYEQGKQKASEMYESGKQKAGEMYESGKEKASESAESAKDRTRSAYEQGKESAGLAWEQTKGSAKEASEKTKEGVEQAKQKAGEACEKGKEKQADVQSKVQGASITTTYKSI